MRLLRLVLFAACIPVTGASAAQPTFTNITPPSGSPTAKRSCGAALQSLSDRDRIWNFGGYRIGGATNELYYYDTKTAGFTAVSQTNAPTRRDRHVVGFDVARQRLVIFGGTQSSLSNPVAYGDLHVFNPAAGSWSQPTITGAKPSARADARLHWVPLLNSHLMFGGTGDPNGPTPRYNDLWTLQLDNASNTATWTLLTPSGTPPSPRGASCTAFDTDQNRLIVFSGESDDGVNIGGTFQYDVATNTWITDSPTGTVPASRAFCQTGYDPVGKRVVLYGGSIADTSQGDVYTYDTVNKVWTAHPGAVKPSGLTTMANSDLAWSPALGANFMFGGRVSLLNYTNKSYSLVLNRIPIASAGPDQSVGETIAVVLDGTGSSDADADPLTWSWTQIAGPAVTLSSPTAQQPTFTSPTVTSPVTLSFSLTVSDGVATSAVDTVNVTVQDNVNEPPVANAGADQSASAAAIVTLDGTASSDPNSEALTFAWTQVSGPSVTLTNANTATAWFTAPSPATVQTLEFRLTVTDARGATAQDGVLVVVSPPGNSVPTAHAGANQSVGEGTSVALDGSGSSDADGDPLSYQWSQIAGPTVTLSSTTAQKPTFTAPTVTSNQTLTFRLIVHDGKASSSADDVNVVVQNTVNEAPSANAGPDQTVGEGVGVTLDGTASSDPNGDTLTRLWTQTAGPAVALSSATASRPTFTSPAVTASTTLTFSLRVDDGKGGTSTDVVDILVQNTVNEAPIANAGADQTVPEASSVTLDGSGSSDPNGDALTWSWVQVAGPTVTLSSTTSATPAFTAPGVTQATQLGFMLTVQDSSGASSTDAVVITVSDSVNEAPVANAGADQTVGEQITAALDGTLSSDPNGETLAFAWTQLSGPSVTLVGANGSTPTFTTPQVISTTTLSFRLTVTDPRGGSSTDTVDVTVQDTLNEPPAANAGVDQTVGEQVAVTLSAAGSSDPNGDALSYQWAQLLGPPVLLSSATVSTPTFTSPGVTASTTLVFRVTVSDGRGGTSSDTTSITVTNSINEAPIAHAGTDRTVAGGATVTLSGTASDPNGDAVTVQWAQTSGPTVALSGASTLNATFTASNPSATTTLVFAFTVTDAHGASTTDDVTVSVTPNGTVPSANAGPDQSVAAAATVSLDGTASADPNGDPLTYTWTQVSGTSVSLSQASSASPTFTAPTPTQAPALLVFRLVVSDGTNASAPDEVTINVARVELPPIARAGMDLSAISGQPFTLDGTGSSDPNGDALTFTWSQVAGPAVMNLDPALAQQTLTAPAVSTQTTLTFQLVVSDAQHSSPPDTVDVTVQPASALPKFASVPRKLTPAGDAYHYDIDDTLEATGTGPITYSLVAGPPGMTVSSAGVVTYLPPAGGEHLVHVRAANAVGVDDQIFALKVVERPVITSVPQTKSVAQDRYFYDADATPSAAGAKPIRWKLVSGPAQMMVVSSTGEIVWTPPTDGTFDVTLRAENAFGFEDQRFTVDVGAAEVLAIAHTANLHAAVGLPWQYDADGKVDVTPASAYVFSDGAPYGAVIESTTRRVTWVPTEPGTFHFVIVAGHLYDETRYEFDVTVLDTPPTPPQAVAHVTPPSGDAPLPVTLDGTQSTPPPGRSLLTWEWDFGDGTAPVVAPTTQRTFSVPGGYNLTLTVVDDLGGSDHDQVQLLVGSGGILPPSAKIRADKVVGRDRLEVAFGCDCTDPQGRALTYLWEFGDGDASTNRDQTHVYLEPGRYRARLTVTNGVLLTRDTVSILVTAGDRLPPEATVYASTSQGPAPLKVTFTSAARDLDGTIAWRRFEFPYGQASDLPQPTFTFTEPGIHVVRFTVMDSDGLSASDTVEVTVTTADGTVPPKIFSLGSRRAMAGRPYLYDEDGRVTARGTGPVRFALGREELGKLSGVPEGASIDPDTGAVTWQPRAAGVHRLVISASNPAGVDWQELTVNVTPAEAVAADETSGCGCGASGGTGAFALMSLLLMVARSRPSRWGNKARAAASGLALLLVTLIPARAEAANAPAITSTPTTTGSVFAAWKYDADGLPTADGDGLVVEWALTRAPPAMFIDNLTGEIFWYPEAAGSYPVELAAATSAGEVRQAFVVAVAGEMPPNITVEAPTQMYVGQKVVVDLTADGSQPMTWALDSTLGGVNVQSGLRRMTYLVTQTPGQYRVDLRAANRAGVDTWTWNVEVVSAPFPPPVARFTAEPATGDAPLLVAFDASSSSSGVSVNTKMKYEFDYGDGSVSTGSLQPKVLHRYASPGVYNVTLSLTNVVHEVDTETMQVVVTSNGRIPPSAKIIANAASGPAPHRIELSCECVSPESPIVSWHWTYGDGEHSTVASPAHIYPQPGGFVVKLTVTDERGLSSTAELPVSIKDGEFAPPFALARASQTNGDAPLGVQFASEYGDSDGVVVFKRWYLPDGSIVTDDDPARIFNNVGSYTAKLEVVDDRGLKAVDTVEIRATRNGALPPQILSRPTLEALAGHPWSYDEDGRLSARGGPKLVWELGKVVAGERVNVPEGMAIDPDGRITWTPSAQQLGPQNVTVTVSNAAGTDVQDFTVDVIGGGVSVPAGGCGCTSGFGASAAPVLLLVLTALARGDVRRRRRMR